MKKQLIEEIQQFKKIAGLLNENWHPDDNAGPGINDGDEEEDPEDFDDISETEGEGTDYDESSDSESDDTDAMGGIDEAGNIKGIKIDIPGNSNAIDFGKAAAREVVESFGPREYKNFLEAFLAEFKKVTGGR